VTGGIGGEESGSPTGMSDPAEAPVPDFARGSDLLTGAYRLARFAHHGPRREGDTDIDHPVAVAELLAGEGFDERVVAAALLHDVVEDTTTKPEEIEERFGPEVATLVREMTEDSRIEDYPERKAEHRARVSSDRPAAAIYAADKLASARAKDGAAMPGDQLAHYIATLRTLRETNPELPFLGDLRNELERLVRDREAA
jgi:GTP diphosphokinase / guanosine-3',5'-bis(diphosphate) 3'-diphosphatase